jgi:hypothetical protein
VATARVESLEVPARARRTRLEDLVEAAGDVERPVLVDASADTVPLPVDPPLVAPARRETASPRT